MISVEVIPIQRIEEAIKTSGMRISTKIAPVNAARRHRNQGDHHPQGPLGEEQGIALDGRQDPVGRGGVGIPLLVNRLLPTGESGDVS